MFLFLILSVLKGACLSAIQLKCLIKSARARSGSDKRQILFRSHSVRSFRKFWESKFLKFLFEMVRGFALGIFIFLIQAIGQWSLQHWGRTSLQGYLSGLFVRNISINDEFDMFFTFGRVGEDIS